MKWTRTRLGNVVNLKRGYDLPDSQRNSGLVPIVSSSGITAYHNEAKVKGPGVVTGRYGTLGAAFFVKDDYWPLNTTLYVQDFKGNDERFISYLLGNLNLASYRSAGAVPGVNRNFLHEIEVTLPPLPIQQKIAAILSAYDDLIENNLKRIALLEKSARLLYEEWFVRLRFPGCEHINIVDGVPEGWENGTISEFYDTSSGGTPSRKNPEFYTGEIHWVKTQELTNSYIFSTDEKITEEAIKKSSAKIFPENTVIVAMYGATIGQLGILAAPATTNQACCAILNKGNAGHIYAYLFLLHNKEGLVNLSMGAAQKNISQNIIRSYSMVMPQPSILAFFEEQLSPSFSQIKNLQLQNQKLKQARDILLPKLINGEITV